MTNSQTPELIGRGFIRKIHENWPFFVITAAFCVLWLPHVFIINNSLNFITAFEADPGGMVDGILRHLSTYNMNGGYYSKYYGWSFFFIAFWVLKPTALVLKAFHLYSDSLLFCLIRLLNFSICLTSVVALYLFLKRLFKNIYYAAIGCLFYIVPAYLAQGGVSFSLGGGMQNYFYFIHPEPTGFLFLFLGLWMLEVFRENIRADKTGKLYFAGVLFLALACFAKQPFVFVAVPVYVLYVKQYSKMQNLSLGTFVSSRAFLVLFLKTIIFCVLLFYIMNPYSFLEPKMFVKNQLRLVRAFGSGPMTLSIVEAWKQYLNVIGRSLFLCASILISLIDITILLLRNRHRQKRDRYFLVLLISSFPILGIFMTNSRFFISINYLAPVIVYLIIGDILLIREVLQISQKRIRTISLATLCCILAFVFALGGQAVIRYGIDRLKYKETNFYRVYEYVKNNIPNGARVAVSHTVAIPPEKELAVFQWWQEDPDKVADFNPDFLIYQKGFSINGVPTKEAKAFDGFVTREGYREVANLENITVFSRK